MEFINGYKYIDEAAAQAAVDLCNEHYGIVAEEGKVTENYVSYVYDAKGFYYIRANDSLIEVLGESYEFEITPPKSFLWQEQ
jgi:hypothetical protein